MKRVFFSTVVIAVFYFLATTYLMNSRLAIDALLGNYPLTYRSAIFTNLILGMWSVMGGLGVTILLIIAGLTGLNLSILGQRIGDLSKTGNMKFVIGGGSVLGLATSGCAACGLPILSLLGLGSSLTFLPLRGLELSYLSIVLLTISLFLLIRSNKVSQTCVVPNY